MDKEEAKTRILEQIDDPAVAKEVMCAIFGLVVEKPSGLNQDQEITFQFLMRWSIGSSTLYQVFFPKVIEELWKCTPHSDNPKPVPDVFSVPILLRSLYEEYLVAFSLLDQGISVEQRRCRYLAWYRRGWETEVTTARHFRASTEAQQYLTEEFEKADTELRDDPYFSALKPAQTKRLLRGGRDGNWGELAIATGICENFHNFLYPTLCSYAHSDSSSYRRVLNGTWSGLMDVWRTEFLFIAALMLDLTRQHLFRSHIDENVVLEVVMDYGLGYVREFSAIAGEK